MNFNFNNFEEEDPIPPLIPLKKKKMEINSANIPTTSKDEVSNDDLKNILLQSIKGTPTSQQGNRQVVVSTKREPNPGKIQEIEKKAKEKISTVPKKDNNNTQSIENNRAKEAEKMKYAISKMLNSMQMKNLSEQLYPVSNEAIQNLLGKIEEEIKELKQEGEKKQAILAINQNNLHLKKQLQTIKRQIDHCCLIKEMYYQKLNYRHKIQTLQEDILNMSNENKDLKIKLAKSLQAIENYRQNLPVNNEKQLQEKLNSCMNELNQERSTRTNLQKNIENIINNFKRLYDEAEAARLIVSRKLKELEERQRRVRRFQQKQQDDKSQEIVSPVRRVNTYENGQKNLNISYSDAQNDYSATLPKKGNADQQMRKNMLRQKAPVALTTKDEKEKRNTNVGLTLEEKINKMRGNQAAINKALQS